MDKSPQIQRKYSRDIAIIGISGRFPGAKDVEEFWRSLSEGKDSITEAPKDRWDDSKYYDPDPLAPNKYYCRWGGFLDDIEKFDALFFNISGKEAQQTDPQQRIFLEECWKALEDAGYAGETISGLRCGVFVGVEACDYKSKMYYEEGVEKEWQSFWGNNNAVLAARISHALNLKGPCLAVNTACSSSLVTIHLACQSILSGESDMAVAGGVFVLVTPTVHILTSKGRMLSYEGKCRSFDSRGDGFVLGEGAGAVILKSLEAAIKDGDHVYGVVKATGVNQEGKVNHIWEPVSDSQTALELSVYEKGNINPETITYVEALGTGAKLSDAMEIHALTAAFKHYTDKKQYCAVGSLRTNIGHSVLAAGVASVIKVLLSLKNEKIAPSLNFEEPNENINFEESPFFVNTELRDWKKNGNRPRRAAINAFSFSGTNAHMVIEEAPGPRPRREGIARPYYFIPLSAKTEAALNNRIVDLMNWLEKEGKARCIGDMEYTLNMGRSHFPIRSALVVSDIDDLRRSMNEIHRGNSVGNSLFFNGKGKRFKPEPALEVLGKKLIEELGEGDRCPKTEYKEKLFALADLYTKGYSLNWRPFYQRGDYRRISMPVYPFTKKSYWPEGEKRGGDDTHHRQEVMTKLHPLVGRNISNFKEQRFITRFMGDEFFLAIHRENGKKVVPGLVYLEMARAAAEIAGEKKVRTIKNIVWDAPALLDETSGEFYASLYLNQDKVEYEVSSIREAEDNERIAYCQGEITYERNGENQLKRDCIDIEAAKKRCLHGKNGEATNRLLESSVLKNESAFETIREFSTNGAEAIACLKLPESLKEGLTHFILHPILMEAILQVTISLAGNSQEEFSGLYLPVSLEEIEILNALPGNCYVTAALTKSQKGAPSGVKKFDLKVLDEMGQILVKMRGFSVRILQQQPQTQETAPKEMIVDMSEGAAHPDEEFLLCRVQKDLLEKVSETLKMSIHDIDLGDNMSGYGFDSVSLTDFANRLNETYKLDITPAHFFEHPSVDSFSRYLLDNYRDNFIQYYRESSREVNRIAAKRGESVPAKRVKLRLLSERWKRVEMYRSEKRHVVNEPIAIIGMSGVMPGSENLEEFWKNLEEGKDLISEIPPDRWDWRAYYGDPLKESNKTNIKWGGFIKDVDKFDALFFGISRKEAELMDPQQRIFLETVWKTIEDAGYRASDLSGTKTGLFVGVCSTDYNDLLRDHNIGIEAHTSFGLSHSILANRISYLFNLRGPSEPIDTACSSSLVAIHRAIESIQNGDSEMAIAGGVNALLSPTYFFSFNKAGMLCEDGRCKTFDKRANGYVRGEGAGAIFLKTLSRAEADGDHIYGLIKSSSINHGGHAQSLSAPNPNAQAELLITAYEKAEIDPATVSYIEAHGTGTAIGDPIEINGLRKAFEELYKRAGSPLPEELHCGIGSVKANIGHLESAAGIAGLIKVVLAMKNKKLPGNIHFNELNPYIRLQGSPFYVVKETRPWECLKDRENRPIPRLAGVSSFGFGGVNAHIVVEEYNRVRPQSTMQDQGPWVFVLSAKNDERLKAYTRQMVDFLETAKREEETESGFALTDVVYTLQVGREAMEERLALIVFSMKELVEKLKKFCQDDADIENLYRGHRNRAKAETLLEGSTEEDFIKRAVNERELGKPAQLWVLGVEVDWRLFYPHDTPQRVSLPVYPFDRERYWIPESEDNSDGTDNGWIRIDRLHPMIDRNTSTIREQKFTTHLTGNEFYLTDHRVDERKILPAAVSIEMACASGKIAVERPIRIMKNIMWVRPIVFKEPSFDVHIGFYPYSGFSEYNVFTIGNEGQRQVHSQGQIVYGRDGGTGFENKNEDESIDIEAIKKRCTNPISKSECYDLFRSMGLEYGPSFRSIQELFSNGTEALSSLLLPDAQRDGFHDFVLHPSLVDGALQTVIVLLSKREEDFNLFYLPYALNEVRILKPLSQGCYAYVSLVEDVHTTDAQVKKFHIWVMNEVGQVLLGLKDLLARPYRRGVKTVSLPARGKHDSDRDHYIQDLFQKLEAGKLKADEVERLMEKL